MRQAATAFVLLWASAPYAAPAPPPHAPPVTVNAQIDRTAVWVGDVLRYTLRAVHPADVEIVVDNFKKDLLPVAPFVVRDIEIRRGRWADGKRSADIVLWLSAYETGKTELTIPPVQVYYFKHTPGPAGKESPVESVTVPAFKVGLRSTLVPARPAPRETKAPPAHGLRAPLALLLLGSAGLAALAGYLGWGLWKRRRAGESTRQLTREQRERIVQDGLARVRAGVAAAGDDPRRGAAAIAAGLRGFAEAMFQLPATALTPEEVEAALQGGGADVKLAAEIKTVLARCDELHYGKDAGSAQRPRAELVEAAEGILRAPQWVAA